MRRVLVTTTIHVPTNLRDWATQLSPGDRIIVAGDLKTPHTEVRELLEVLALTYGITTSYLAPGDDTQRYRTHSTVGYNSIQRRNLALLEALDDDEPWDYLITVDDDNYPEGSHWVAAVDEYLFADDVNDASRFATASGWYNVGQLCRPTVTHRGYPLTRRGNVEMLIDSSDTPTRVGVFASLWTGDPDIDAIERAVVNPYVESVVGGVTLDAGTWCPFNSQATAYRRELAPLMFMWPHVGRMDDIWSSLAARVVMDALGWHVRYGPPTVHQRRNEHDVVRDIEQEMIGYRYTERLADVLHGAATRLSSDMNPVEAARLVYSDLSNYGTFIPNPTVDAFAAWFDDLHLIGVK
jgi:hypothetical protein